MGTFNNHKKKSLKRRQYLTMRISYAKTYCHPTLEGNGRNAIKNALCHLNKNEKNVLPR